jgi:hypothetical protein
VTDRAGGQPIMSPGRRIPGRHAAGFAGFRHFVTRAVDGGAPGRFCQAPAAIHGAFAANGLKWIHITQIRRITRLRIFKGGSFDPFGASSPQCSGARRQPRSFIP